MDFKLIPIEKKDITEYKIELQKSFQIGFEQHFGRSNEVVLPEKDIDQSLNAFGSVAYIALMENKMVGGAIVCIDQATQNNHLDFLFVKSDAQGLGLGRKIWFEIEKLYPETKIWSTCTPYFDRRNIHFYVNICKFIIDVFYNEKYPMPNVSDDFIGDGDEGMFEFKKYM